MVPLRIKKEVMSNIEKALRVTAPALPATREQWQRDMKGVRTINDYVEDIHMLLVDDKDKRERYLALLSAVYDEQAMEGSLSCDNCLAAAMIRDRAKALGEHSPLVTEKLATISKALGVVLRRYHQSRKERRNMIGGQAVPNDPAHPDEVE